jgi:hypothetical protein
MNNYWGPPDDDGDLPDWMLASTYQNGNQPKRRGKSLEQIAEEALQKPLVPVIIVPPNLNGGNND